jgi:hypothetical protein
MLLYSYNLPIAKREMMCYNMSTKGGQSNGQLKQKELDLRSLSGSQVKKHGGVTLEIDVCEE